MAFAGLIVKVTEIYYLNVALALFNTGMSFSPDFLTSCSPFPSAMGVSIILDTLLSLI